MAKDDFFDDACCNNHCNNPANNNFDISFIWILIIIFLFRGSPFGHDCFWDGYCNAFNSSGFSCRNFNKTIGNNNFNFNNDNANNFFNNN